jgi:hypothetical protein
VFFYCTARGIERQITWYLAVDQFGYLQFAHDLLAGHVFHEWPPLRALQGLLPERTDVLAQTYVYDGGRLYCRYSPGFPLLLAGWIRLFGTQNAHYLNPLVYLVLLVVALAFQWRVFRSPWRAVAGTALIALFPTLIYLWGITLTRDLSAHLFAFSGLFLLLPARGRPLRPARLFPAGLLLGFGITIRPDAVLYLVPASLMLLVRWRHERGRHATRLSVGLVVALTMGLSAGMSPLLAYNWVATGNPLVPTQGMEVPLLEKAPSPPSTASPAPTSQPVGRVEAAPASPPRGWRGGTQTQVTGGGLRLSHLKTTAPGNWRIMLRAYSPLLLGVAVWGAAIATVLRPTLAVAGVSYGIVAFVFFGCWPHPDYRYLIGVFLFVPMLVVEGVVGSLDLVRLLWKRHKFRQARALAMLCAALWLSRVLWPPSSSPGTVPAPMFLAIALVAGSAALLSAVLPSRRVGALAAPTLMLALVWIKVSEVEAKRAPFQRPQMLEARANMQRLLEPGSVVITVEEVGRPAENIEYYSNVAQSLYLTDLERWRLNLPALAVQLIRTDMHPYLFIPFDQRAKASMLGELRNSLSVDLVADIAPGNAMAHFVAAPFHRGVRMELYRISAPSG